MATGVLILFGLTFYIVCISSSYMPNKVQGPNGEEVEAIGKRQDTIEPTAVEKRGLSDEAPDATLEQNAVAKPVNGGWGAWNWNLMNCSKTCGGGRKTVFRTCDNPKPSNGGSYCPNSDSITKTVSCNTHSCNADNGCKDLLNKDACQKASNYCDRGGWKDWINLNCNATCDMCNKNRVPTVDGGWGAWKDGQCNKSCGGGTMMSIRYCDNPSPSGKGGDCFGRGGPYATTLQTQTKQSSCNTQSCPVNGGWGAWNWGQCSKSCGGGQKTASRACNNPAPINEGRYCSGPTTQSASCNTYSCNADNGCKDTVNNCKLMESYCDTVKEGWKASLMLNCNKTCDFCNKDRVPSVHGNWGAWKDGQCSKSCGGGTKMKIRYCNNPSPSGKFGCFLFATTLQTQNGVKSSCNTQSCGVVGNWGAWTETKCSKSCGEGTKTRSRSCNNPSPTNGEDCWGRGEPFATTLQTENKQSFCNIKSCDGKCKDSWSVSYCNTNVDYCTSKNNIGMKKTMKNACKNTCNLC